MIRERALKVVPVLVGLLFTVTVAEPPHRARASRALKRTSIRAHCVTIRDIFPPAI